MRSFKYSILKMWTPNKLITGVNDRLKITDLG